MPVAYFDFAQHKLENVHSSIEPFPLIFTIKKNKTEFAR